MIRLYLYEIMAYWRGTRAPFLGVGCYLILRLLMGYAAQHDPSYNDHSLTHLAFQWIAIVTASLLGLERIWHDDAKNHRLIHYKMSPYPLWLIVIIKAKAFWWAMLAPLVILFTAEQALVTHAFPLVGFLALLLATGTLCMLLTLTGLLTLGSSNGTPVGLLILFPFLIPPLTFGLGAQIAEQQQSNPWPALALLAASLLFTLLIAPIASTFLLRNIRT